MDGSAAPEEHHGPCHRRRLPRARGKPFRIGRPRRPAHARLDEGRDPARALEEQGGGHGAPRDRRRQGALRSAEHRGGPGIHRGDQPPRVRLIRTRSRRDRELEAGSLAHYEDAAYYTATYRNRIDDVAYYVTLAERAGGPVLEYGVGNGRIAVPIARHGV